MTRHLYPPPAHTGGMHPGDDWQRYQQGYPQQQQQQGGGYPPPGYPQQQGQGQWCPQPGDPVVPLTAQPGFGIEEPMRPSPFLRQPRVLVALAAVMALMIGGAGWFLFAGHTAVSPVTSSSVPAVGATGAQIQEMWYTLAAPCKTPVGSAGKPPDPHGMLAPDETHKLGKWLTAEDFVIPRLGETPSPADAEFIGKRLLRIDIVLSQVRGWITGVVNAANTELRDMPTDSEAFAARLAEAKGDVDAHYDQFDQMLTHELDEISSGHQIPDPPAAAVFQTTGTCVNAGH